eukprot:TRINITY_DN6786_c2_g1_i1.p1 TRINITY_DN6786_c2_g1~~TRINITY_DN6786_c2_g1_i1.p1  ORF type:complete len:918 (-),score=165.86 TRINITY_DN6786_c2_g1_i1:272-3025(-)
MAIVLPTTLIAYLVGECLTLHSPIVISGAPSTSQSEKPGPSPNPSRKVPLPPPQASLTDFARRVRADELATNQLLSTVRLNLKTRQAAVDRATSAESKRIAEVALEEATRVAKKVKSLVLLKRPLRAFRSRRPSTGAQLHLGQIKPHTVKLKKAASGPKLAKLKLAARPTNLPEQLSKEAQHVVRGRTKLMDQVSTEARTSVIKRMLTNDKAKRDLAKELEMVAHDSMTSLKKVAYLAPLDKMSPIASMIGNFLAGVKKVHFGLNGSSLETYKHLLDNTTSTAKEALLFGLDALPEGNLKLRKHLHDLVKRLEKISLHAKKQERKQVIAEMYMKDDEARAEGGAKAAQVRAEGAVEKGSAAIDTASNTVKNLSTHLRMLPPKAAAETLGAIVKERALVRKARAVRSHAKNLAARARKTSKSISKVAARKMGKDAEELYVKANELDQTATKDGQEAKKLVESDQRAVYNRTEALKEAVGRRVDKDRLVAQKYQTHVNREVSTSREEMRSAQDAIQKHLAKQDLAAAKKDEWRMLMHKQAIAKLEKAFGKAISGKTKAPDGHTAHSPDSSVEVLEALDSTAKELGQREAADDAKAEHLDEVSQEQLACSSGQQAIAAITRLETAADLTKRSAEAAKQLGRGDIETAPCISAKQLGDIAKATYLTRIAKTEIEKAKNLENDVREAERDPDDAVQILRKVSMEGAEVVEKAEEHERQSKRVEDRIMARAKGVLRTENARRSKSDADVISNVNRVEKALHFPKGTQVLETSAKVTAGQHSVKEIQRVSTAEAINSSPRSAARKMTENSSGQSTHDTSVAAEAFELSEKTAFEQVLDGEMQLPETEDAHGSGDFTVDLPEAAPKTEHKKAAVRIEDAPSEEVDLEGWTVRDDAAVSKADTIKEPVTPVEDISGNEFQQDDGRS